MINHTETEIWITPIEMRNYEQVVPISDRPLHQVLSVPTGRFQEFEIESGAAVGLSGDLDRWLGCKLEPTLAYDYPTIEALSIHLVGLVSPAARKQAAAPAQERSECDPQ